jgi:NAD-dependent deacetylase
MKKLVVLTGAGISAESGLKTFRGAGGLWEGHNVQDVATPQAFRRNPEMVLRFYNERRRQLFQVEPNAGHLGLVELEKHFDVQIITQNIDDLHERAGSSRILHLHGQLKKKRSVANENLIADCEGDIEVGDLAPDGGQWRPHIVWFGEDVPMLYDAADLAAQADVMLIVGTSMVVYPANTLINFAPRHAPVYIVDPNKPAGEWNHSITFVEEPASTGVKRVIELLTS